MTNFFHSNKITGPRNGVLKCTEIRIGANTLLGRIAANLTATPPIVTQYKMALMVMVVAMVQVIVIVVVANECVDQRPDAWSNALQRSSDQLNQIKRTWDLHNIKWIPNLQNYKSNTKTIHDRSCRKLSQRNKVIMIYDFFR